jgi:hypothetical protein
MFDRFKERLAKLEEDHDNIRKMHQHVEKHKIVYIAGASGLGFLVIGGISGAALGKTDVKQTVDSLKLIHIQWKSPNTIIALVKPELRPPQPVLDKTTGIPYPSLNQAAKYTGEILSKVRADAHGAQLRFEHLPDSVFA